MHVCACVLLRDGQHVVEYGMVRYDFMCKVVKLLHIQLKGRITPPNASFNVI